MEMDSCDLLCLDLEDAAEVRASLDVQRIGLLAAALNVFADPTRLLIVQALGVRELCGCGAGWVTDQSDKVVSHHLCRLRREGLVTSRREGKVVFAALTDHGRGLLAAVQGVAA